MYDKGIERLAHVVLYGPSKNRRAADAGQARLDRMEHPDYYIDPREEEDEDNDND